MELSQDIIYARLAKAYPVRFNLRSNKPLSLERPAIFDPDANVSKCVVIITPEELDSIDPSHPNYDGVLFVSIRPLDASYNYIRRSILSFEEEVSLARALNEVQAIFSLFGKWEHDLDSVIYTDRSFQELIDCSEAVFFDAFCIQDRDYRYVCYSQASEDRGLVSEFVDTDTSYPLEIVNRLMTDPYYGKRRDSREVFATRLSIGYGITKNIFYKDGYVGKAVVHVFELSDTMYYYYAAILETIVTYIESLYARYRGFTRNETAYDTLRSFVVDFLDRKNVSSVQLENVLAEVGWHVDDGYRLVQMKATPRNEKDLHSNYAISAIARDWQGCFAFEYHDKLLLLENENLFVSSNGQGFFQTFVIFLRDNLLAGGVSRIFYRIEDVGTAYEQTEVAFEYGEKLTPMHWCFRFNDFALPYLLDHSTGAFDAYDICSEKLIRLKRYDEEKNSELCKTLATYLECHYNAAAAAKSLCIHRTSFLNRMERIHSIANINLDSYEESLYIALSLVALGEHSSKQDWM